MKKILSMQVNIEIKHYLLKTEFHNFLNDLRSRKKNI